MLAVCFLNLDLPSIETDKETGMLTDWVKIQMGGRRQRGGCWQA